MPGELEKRQGEGKGEVTEVEYDLPSPTLAEYDLSGDFSFSELEFSVRNAVGALGTELKDRELPEEVGLAKLASLGVDAVPDDTSARRSTPALPLSCPNCALLVSKLAETKTATVNNMSFLFQQLEATHAATVADMQSRNADLEARRRELEEKYAELKTMYRELASEQAIEKVQIAGTSRAGNTNGDIRDAALAQETAGPNYADAEKKIDQPAEIIFRLRPSLLAVDNDGCVAQTARPVLEATSSSVQQQLQQQPDLAHQQKQQLRDQPPAVQQSLEPASARIPRSAHDDVDALSAELERVRAELEKERRLNENLTREMKKYGLLNDVQVPEKPFTDFEEERHSESDIRIRDLEAALSSAQQRLSNMAAKHAEVLKEVRHEMRSAEQECRLEAERLAGEMEEWRAKCQGLEAAAVSRLAIESAAAETKMLRETREETERRLDEVAAATLKETARLWEERYLLLVQKSQENEERSSAARSVGDARLNEVTQRLLQAHQSLSHLKDKFSEDTAQMQAQAASSLMKIESLKSELRLLEEHKKQQQDEAAIHHEAEVARLVEALAGAKTAASSIRQEHGEATAATAQIIDALRFDKEALQRVAETLRREKSRHQANTAALQAQTSSLSQELQDAQARISTMSLLPKPSLALEEQVRSLQDDKRRLLVKLGEYMCIIRALTVSQQAVLSNLSELSQHTGIPESYWHNAPLGPPGSDSSFVQGSACNVGTGGGSGGRLGTFSHPGRRITQTIRAGLPDEMGMTDEIDGDDLTQSSQHDGTLDFQFLGALLKNECRDIAALPSNHPLNFRPTGSPYKTLINRVRSDTKTNFKNSPSLEETPPHDNPRTARASNLASLTQHQTSLKAMLSHLAQQEETIQRNLLALEATSWAQEKLDSTDEGHRVDAPNRVSEIPLLFETRISLLADLQLIIGASKTQGRLHKARKH